MSKRVMALFTLMVLTVSAYSQTSGGRCSLTAASAPSVRGLKLGMTADELLALFPAAAKRNDTIEAVKKAKAATAGEVVYLSFNPAIDSGKEQFAGVESVGAGLLNNRVSDFSVVYGGASWTNIDDWIAKLAEAFKLPAAEAWAIGPSETPNKVLRCDQMSIEAAIQGGSAAIRVLNTGSQKAMQDRTKAAEEKQRREIKP